MAFGDRLHLRPPAARFAPLLVLCLCAAAFQAQTIAFDLQNSPDSPIAFVKSSPAVVRMEGGRREFVTLKNLSDRGVLALLVQQAIHDGSKTEIIALERISVIVRPRQTIRLSVNVEDAWKRLQDAAKAGSAAPKPVLSIVAVEFIDGGTWSAP